MKTKTPTIWVIADTHFGHKMLVREKLRPDGYEEKILLALERQCQPGDVLIHLGDFALGDDAHWAARYEMATPGVTNILVRGNHDGRSDSWYMANGFHAVFRSLTNAYFGKKVVFSHRPLLGALLEFDGGMLNVHGHTHGNDHRDFEMPGEHSRVPGTHIEVACETLGYGPVSLKKILGV